MTRPYIDRGQPGKLLYQDGELLRVREPDEPPRKPLTLESMRQHFEVATDADAALEHWAKWALSALESVGWPRKTLLARIIEYGVIGCAQQASGTLLVVGHAVEYDEMCAWVETAVMRLPVEERNVIVVVYLDFVPPDTAAKELGISRGTLDSRLSRARRSVRDYLDGRKAS